MLVALAVLESAMPRRRASTSSVDQQENIHTLKYTAHKQSKQQDKITDKIQTPQ